MFDCNNFTQLWFSLVCAFTHFANLFSFVALYKFWYAMSASTDLSGASRVVSNVEEAKTMRDWAPNALFWKLRVLHVFEGAVLSDCRERHECKNCKLSGLLLLSILELQYAYRGFAQWAKPVAEDCRHRLILLYTGRLSHDHSRYQYV